MGERIQELGLCHLSSNTEVDLHSSPGRLSRVGMEGSLQGRGVVFRKVMVL